MDPRSSLYLYEALTWVRAVHAEVSSEVRLVVDRVGPVTVAQVGHRLADRPVEAEAAAPDLDGLDLEAKEAFDLSFRWTRINSY